MERLIMVFGELNEKNCPQSWSEVVKAALFVE
jgi:hypothetical protein